MWVQLQYNLSCSYPVGCSTVHSRMKRWYECCLSVFCLHDLVSTDVYRCEVLLHVSHWVSPISFLIFSGFETLNESNMKAILPPHHPCPSSLEKHLFISAKAVCCSYVVCVCFYIVHRIWQYFIKISNWKPWTLVLYVLQKYVVNVLYILSLIYITFGVTIYCWSVVSAWVKHDTSTRFNRRIFLWMITRIAKHYTICFVKGALLHSLKTRSFKIWKHWAFQKLRQSCW